MITMETSELESTTEELFTDTNVFSTTQSYEELAGTTVAGGRSHKSIIVINNMTTVWPVQHAAVVEGDVILGGLMMVHSREDTITCGPIMPQGGIQALEAMLYTLDQINAMELLPNVTVGAHILDDCDKDTYGLEMAVDFIKGKGFFYNFFFFTTKLRFGKNSFDHIYSNLFISKEIVSNF